MRFRSFNAETRVKATFLTRFHDKKGNTFFRETDIFNDVLRHNLPRKRVKPWYF